MTRTFRVEPAYLDTWELPNRIIYVTVVVARGTRLKLTKPKCSTKKMPLAEPSDQQREYLSGAAVTPPRAKVIVEVTKDISD